MASGVRLRARARRVAAVVPVVVAVVASVAGCVGMPNSGPPGSATAVQASTVPDLNTGLFAAAPTAGAPPWEIVQGFLTASASYPIDAVALAYLASKKWDPAWSVTVFSTFNVPHHADIKPAGKHGAKRATVDFSGPVQAAFNATGQYVSAKDQVPKAGAYAFQLVQVNGQWRISNPPDYRIIPAWEFPLSYKAQDLYYFAPAGHVLVPDSVFVPLGTSPSQLVKNLVTALTNDPQTPWLQQGVAVTKFPRGTRVLGVTLDGPAATVNLGGTAMAKASYSQLEQVSAQLVWTLTGSQASPSSVQSVELEINGKPFTPQTSGCGVDQSQSAFQKLAAFGCDNPYPAAPTSFSYVNQGQAWLRCGSETQVQQEQIGPVLPLEARDGTLTGPGCPAGGFVPTNSPAGSAAQLTSLPAMSMLAVSPDGKDVALISSGRDALYLGTLSGRAARFPRTPRWSAPDITALSWDRNDNLWLVEDDSIYMVSASGGKPAPVAEFAGMATDLSVAPDGVRMAIIVQDGAGGQLELAAVNPSGIASGQPAGGKIGAPSAHPYLSPAVPLGPNITDPTSLTWYGADNLLVLDHESDGNMLWEVPVDGQQATGPQLTLAGTVSIAADGAANALVAGLADGSMAVSTGLSVQWQTLSQLGQDPAYP
ncbi:MAG: LpqB family beta-propeller domain-containing protein [Streptosporangiaceae bacterium]